MARRERHLAKERPSDRMMARAAQADLQRLALQKLRARLKAAP